MINEFGYVPTPTSQGRYVIVWHGSNKEFLIVDRTTFIVVFSSIWYAPTLERAQTLTKLDKTAST